MSSFVFAVPAELAAASTNLAGLGSSIRAANAGAAGATTQLMVAAEDEISSAIATLFGGHGQEYQLLSSQVAAYHDQFVRALSSGGLMYGAADAAAASPLQTLEQNILGLINAPTNTFLGRPLIGDGANGAAGTGHCLLYTSPSPRD